MGVEKNEGLEEWKMGPSCGTALGRGGRWQKRDRAGDWPGPTTLHTILKALVARRGLEARNNTVSFRLQNALYGSNT